MAELEAASPLGKEVQDTEKSVTNGDEEDLLAERDDGPPKKRRRTVRPNADKKFECKHEGCGKTYSRAEHLYRHQLNHAPKQIYHCDFPDCNRYFVRQDLCVRHRERHTTHGSQLHKRDTFAQASASQSKSSQPTSHVSGGAFTSGEPETPSNISEQYIPTDPALESMDNDIQSQTQSGSFLDHKSSPLHVSAEATLNSPARLSATQNSSLFSHQNSNGSLALNQRQNLATWRSRKESSGDTRLGSLYGQAQARSDGTAQKHLQSPSRTFSNSSPSSNHFSGLKSNIDPYLQSSGRGNSYVQSADIVSTGFGDGFRSPNLARQSSDAFTAAVSRGLGTSTNETYLYPDLSQTNAPIDVNAAYGYPIFGGDEHNATPFALADDFTNWLFNDNQSGPTGYSPNDVIGTFGENPISQVQGPFFSQSPSNSLIYQNNLMLTHPMSVSSILDSTASSNYIMSEAKRQELLDIMQMQFVERPHDAVKRRKDAVFEGDIDSDGHVLSLQMMHTYIGSYWYHQHAQLPILHKPTFSADKTPTLLLLAVIAIGAATMDKAYGTALTDSAAEFANFVAWHIRWEIIRDVDFRPPAKLWVFQTLLLIEVYEKMYATRALHERAHIHHDSTLTLMRRGSSLIGRSASDSPPSLNEDKNGKSLTGGNLGAYGINSSEESWMRWVTTEATRRAAFGAFVIDSIHCTMFGHSAKMVAHEMRLPLPCDEALWSATSPGEVGRVQSSLQSNGIKPIMFLDGLKRTLNGQRVRTNSFGRTIIMGGLLSVSWHMTQRDLQIASIGPRAASSFGGPDKWKGTLLRAFDNWKRDFDEALAESAPRPSSPARLNGPSVHTLLKPVDDENIFESRTVLHHLAHIAAHVDIIDCQVFAGANRLLSRSVTPKDYSMIREKIEKWATRASARDSAFYALKFLAQVLIPPKPDDPNSLDNQLYGHASPILPQAYESNRYVARDDFLLNRPWVLYISALVVWCYGYALEGPIAPSPRDQDFETYEQREQDMLQFLDRVAGVRAPDDLEHVSGKNRCLGLLLILRESLGGTRWELTHEAAGLLGNAAMKLRGRGHGEETMGSGRDERWPSSGNNNNNTRKLNGGGGGGGGGS